MASKKLKASDRQTIAKKIVTILKKTYGGKVPKQDRPVLETMLFAACLENTSYEQAERGFALLHEGFHDLNEVRVSSIAEIEAVLDGMPDAAWRALWIRDTLQYVFESNYTFDFEVLRRKTMDSAVKQLEKIERLSPFIKLHTLQTSLDSHVVPVDEMLTQVAIWLGLVPPDSDVPTAADELKPALRKADAPLFVFLLRQLATDPKYADEFDELDDELEADANEAPKRLEALLKSGGRKKKKTTRVAKKPKKAPKKRKAAKKTSAKKKVTKKKPARKAAKRKTTRKK